MIFFSRMTKDNKRIIYTVLEYNPLLDSSNMTTEDWGRIGKDIEVPKHHSYPLPCYCPLPYVSS